MKKTSFLTGLMAVFATCLLLLESCSTLSLADYKPQNKPINPKLPAMEKSIDDYYKANVQSSDLVLRIFNKEVDENLTSPYGQKYGFIALKTNSVGKPGGIGFAIIDVVTLMIPPMFGAPFIRPKVETESEILIFNSKHELIGKYTGNGKGSQYVGLYYGMLQPKAALEAFNGSLDEIRVKIQSDMPRLKAELDKAGPIAQR